MEATRTYTMGARAEAVRETRRRIMAAAFELAQTTRIADIGLDAVARGAGVSVQTILRHFGSRAGMITATMAYAMEVIVEERATPVGDVDAALKVVVDHYERRGDTALLLLAQETTDAFAQTVAEDGKRLHREWVAGTFAPYATDEATLDLLVVATDVYTWKLLRRDRGLSRSTTEARMGQLVRALLPQNRS